MKNIAVIYARLSREDEDKIDGNKESRSIENQIKALTDYANENNMEIYKVYYDDGYSGSNLDRPDFQLLLKDVYAHKFNILLIKDISRLGRKLYQVGNLIEKVFPENQIRVISLNDNYDSSNYLKNEPIVIRNFLNDYYLKDFRKKCKKALEHRARTKHLNYYPKYGYNFNSKREEIIDDYSSKIVKWIFKMAVDGYSTPHIAKTLNENGVLTRSRYALEILGLKPLNKKPAVKWDGQKVWEILKDYEYCGHSINLIRSENPILIKNTHLAIIDEETFEIANKNIKDKYGQGKYKQVSLSPIIIDKNTGWHLVYCKRHERFYYYSKQQSYSIDAEILHSLLYKDILNIISIYINNEDNLKKIYYKRMFPNNQLDEEKLNANLKSLNKDFQNLFEKQMIGEITPNQYEKKANELSKQIREVEEEINMNKNILSKFNIFKIKFNKFMMNIANEDLSKREIIKLAISKVFISKSNDDYNIDIHYKFEEV